MPAAIKSTTRKTHYRLDPCPAEERVAEFYDVPDGYEVHERRATEGYRHEEGGIVYQKCGGGRRVVKKKIGGD